MTPWAKSSRRRPLPPAAPPARRRTPPLLKSQASPNPPPSSLSKRSSRPALPEPPAHARRACFCQGASRPCPACAPSLLLFPAQPDARPEHAHTPLHAVRPRPLRAAPPHSHARTARALLTGPPDSLIERLELQLTDTLDRERPSASGGGGRPPGRRCVSCARRACCDPRAEPHHAQGAHYRRKSRGVTVSHTAGAAPAAFALWVDVETRASDVCLRPRWVPHAKLL